MRPTAQAVSFGSLPARIWVAHVPLLALQFFGADLLDVQSARLGGAVGNFDPAATRVRTRSRGHPDHVLSAFCGCTCLPCRYWFQIKIQLRRLIRLGLRVHNRTLHCAIDHQRYPVNAGRQTLGNITALRIGLDRIEQLFAVLRLDPNICAFYRLTFCVLDDPLDA